MNYNVLETQDHTEPLEQWTVVATFETEEEALEFSVLHYETQVFSDEADYDIESGLFCVCKDCAELYRPVDRMALVVHVAEANK
jgi:hypothetical protein